jgi:hypothetical protein
VSPSLANAYLEATEALLLIPGDFEAEAANGNVVEIYPLARTKVLNRDDNGKIDGNQDPRACRKVTI